MKWIIIAVIVLAVAASVAGYVFQPGTPVEAAVAQRMEIRQFIDERGKTRLPREYLITMPVAARVDEIAVDEGDPVKQGEPLARLVQADMDTTLDQAQAAVDRLDAAIKESKYNEVEKTSLLQAGKFVQATADTVTAAANRMSSGLAKLQYAESNLGRINELFRSGAKTEDDRELANVQFIEAKVDYRQDQLVHSSMMAILAATKLMPEMIEEYIFQKSLNTAVLEKERAEAAARLRQVQLDVERSTMSSPVDGVVLERLITNERYLPAGELLLKVGDLSRLEIEAEVLSQDVVDVRKRNEVEIYGPAVGRRVGEGIRGAVKRVFPAGFTKVSSLGVEQQRVKVIIGFGKNVLPELLADREIGVDYRVRVRIFTATKSQALVVPRSALFRGADGGWQLFAVSGGYARLTNVETGLMNDQQVEITSGLEEGATVVLAPETSLEDGTKVNAVKRE